MKRSILVKGGLIVGVCVGIVCGLWASNSLVFGHARFVGANIENGKVYTSAELPDRLELIFEGELTPRSQVYVFSVPSTYLVDKGDVTIEEEHGGGEHEHKSKLSVDSTRRSSPPGSIKCAGSPLMPSMGPLWKAGSSSLSKTEGGAR
jgi:hypothetical protein